MQSSQMEEQSESDPALHSKVSKECSQRELSINFIQLAKMHLMEYEDIDENEFEIIDQTENNNKSNSILTSNLPTNYLKLHTTFMPIGTNFQTDLPYLISASKYMNSASNRAAMDRLRALKVHDPISNADFYGRFKDLIWQRYGDNRTYQDIVWMKKSLEEFNAEGKKVSFLAYLAIPAIQKFWEETFKNKDLEILKKNNKKKKKKYKGSMDI